MRLSIARGCVLLLCAAALSFSTLSLAAAEVVRNEPVAALEKPPGVYRIIAYGDANTECTAAQNWPNSLRELLAPHATDARRFEVINAASGTATSTEGLARLRKDAAYTPDLVLVSFGWNDARVAPGAEGPAVSIENYTANLNQFFAVAAGRGAEVVFLTRPHRDDHVDLRKRDDWRARIPDYNTALRKVTRSTGAGRVDVQRNFMRNVLKHYFSSESETCTAEGVKALAGLVLARLEVMGLVVVD